ncbi:MULTISPECIES: GNAT family N-acetyltransferase [Vibrio]|uniref:GNAT family N-acetyltransferase n=1 Tax=Vibrio TaxID=662 RepID=UPI000B5C5601|nr:MULTISPECIES: GNAT family protein [Vibrio]HBV77530.1 N-acetyltransferase [Vibrio sp.]
MWLKEVELESNTVKLIPLQREHADDLVAAASDGRLWDLWYTSVPNAETIEAYLAFAFQEQERGASLAFTVLDKSTNKVIGSTRFCNADVKNQRVEIGHTWYAKSYQRSAVNTECKQLLLTHAFEILDAIAVEFNTHWHNQASRTAIARLGAKQDGVLRNHKKMANGGYRDTVVFSIINTEWPVVKMSLEQKLAMHRQF